VLVDEKGAAESRTNIADFVSPAGRYMHDNLKGPTGFVFLCFPVVPRRSPMLECRLAEYWDSGSTRVSSDLGRLKFRNPLFGDYPLWQPEALPAVKSAGEDIKVRLNSFRRTQSPARPPPFGDPTFRFSVTFESPRNKDEKWTLAEAEVTDATGNRMDQDIRFPAGPEGYGIYGVLWPNEAAVRLTLTLKRTSGFLPSELVTFTNLPVLLLNRGSYAPPNGTSLTNSLDGIPIAVRNILTDSWHRMHEPSGWNYCVEAELPTHPPGVIADILEVASDAGNVLTAPDSLGPYGPYPRTSIEYHQDDLTSRTKYGNVTAVTSPAKYLNVTVAVQKTHTVEYLVKPQ
jgi:hypothetical protein